jgi:hypothetical protein
LMIMGLSDWEFDHMIHTTIFLRPRCGSGDACQSRRGRGARDRRRLHQKSCWASGNLSRADSMMEASIST